MWNISSPLLIIQRRHIRENMNSYMLFRVDYLKAFQRAVNLSKFDQAEIRKAWDNADKKIHLEYEKLAFIRCFINNIPRYSSFPNIDPKVLVQRQLRNVKVFVYRI